MSRFHAFTRLVNRTSGQHEIMKGVFEVRSFPRSTTPEENQRMVPACRQHSSVSRLRYGINMRRHIFAFATSKHVRDLEQEGVESILISEIRILSVKT